MMRRGTVRRAIVALAASVFVLTATLSFAGESEIEHLAQVLAIKPGCTVADVGAGSGQISIAMAKVVGPNGIVYATEIEPKLLDKIRAEIQEPKVQNVVVIAGKEKDTGLPSNCCDAIFLRKVYHHLTDPIAIDQSLYRAMRPGGRLAIIDFEPSQRPGESAPAGVPANRGGHGAPKQIVAEELTRAGFVRVQTIDWSISPTTRHYCMLFRKPPATNGAGPSSAE